MGPLAGVFRLDAGDLVAGSRLNSAEWPRTHIGRMVYRFKCVLLWQGRVLEAGVFRNRSLELRNSQLIICGQVHAAIKRSKLLFSLLLLLLFELDDLLLLCPLLLLNFLQVPQVLLELQYFAVSDFVVDTFRF